MIVTVWQLIVSNVRNFIGPYQLLRLIRSGNTTQVWEALKQGKRKRVALKILLQEHRERQKRDRGPQA